MNAKTDLELAYDRLKEIHDLEYVLEDRIQLASQPVYDKNTKLELSEQNIQNQIKEMAKEIANDKSFTNFVLYAVLDGALPFAEALRKELKSLKVKFQYATIQAKSYIGTVSGELTIQSDPKVPPAGKKVLFADDVWDTGKTLDGIAKKALSQHAVEIRNAVLVNKEPEKPRPYKEYKTYVGFTVPEDAFIIGFGLDFEGMLRNEESITAVDKKSLPNTTEQALLDSKASVIKEIDRLTANPVAEKSTGASNSSTFSNNPELFFSHENKTPTQPLPESLVEPGFK